jgi:hypothetical protein
MKSTILFLTAAALSVAAFCLVLPAALDSFALWRARDDPKALADIAVARALTPEVAGAEIESALNGDDVDLAVSFLELAKDRRMSVDQKLVERVAAELSPSARALRGAASFGRGFIYGDPQDLAGYAGAATGDLFVIGDIRDVVTQGTHLARGEKADELVFGLSCVGLLVTAGTYTTLGATASVRAGLSVVKAAKTTGKLSAPLVEWGAHSVREAVDREKLKAALDKASNLEPREAIQMLRDAVQVQRLDGFVTMMLNIERIRANSSAKAALEVLRTSKDVEEIAKIADLAESKRTKTRAISRLMARTVTAADVMKADITHHTQVLSAAFGLFVVFLAAAARRVRAAA